MNQNNSQDKYKPVKGKDLDDIKHYFRDNDEKEPAEYYYQTKVLGDDKNKDSDAKGLVKSITIKRDPNNDLNKNKNVDQLFKEADPNADKDDKTPAYYYYIKVLGDGRQRPDLTEIKQIKPDTKVDDIYNQMKTKGGVMKRPEDNDGIQIFKVVGDVDNNDIADHMKKSGEHRSRRPGQNGEVTNANRGKSKPGTTTGKPEIPVSKSGEYKIYGDKLDGGKPKKDIDEDCAVSKVLGRGIEKIDNGDGDLECIKVSGDKLSELAKPENNNKVHQIDSLFKEADDDKEGANYYYRKVLGGTADRPGEEY